MSDADNDQLIRDTIAHTIHALPPTVRRLVGARIRWEIRPVPLLSDLESGAHKTDRGLFIGQPIRSEDDAEGTGELRADEGDAVAEEDGLPELFADEGEDFAETAVIEPGGVIVIFSANIKPLAAVHVADVILHELAHFLGEDEDGVSALGLEG